MDIEANLRSYLDGGATSDGRKPNERYSSFDYCFNYFQSFREAGNTTVLAHSDNLQLSCLQRGFYLASWGMYRGSAPLLQKSARCLVPVVEVIAATDKPLWQIDANSYTESKILQLWELARKISHARPGMSDILITKIMLGVFGSVPAFDENFTRGCKVEGICATFGLKSLGQIGAFYRANAQVIDTYRVPTLDFLSGTYTQRLYSCAKVIDMAFFTQGERMPRKGASHPASSGG